MLQAALEQREEDLLQEQSSLEAQSKQPDYAGKSAAAKRLRLQLGTVNDQLKLVRQQLAKLAAEDGDSDSEEEDKKEAEIPTNLRSVVHEQHASEEWRLFRRNVLFPTRRKLEQQSDDAARARRMQHKRRKGVLQFRDGDDVQAFEDPWETETEQVKRTARKRQEEKKRGERLAKDVTMADILHDFLRTPPLVESYPQMARLAEIVLCYPMSNADVERGFSAMNRIKTSLRTRLLNENLNALMLISLEGGEDDDIFVKACFEQWKAALNRAAFTKARTMA